MHAHMPPYTKQQPTGAYRAPAEMPEAERKLRTALAYVNHARDLIRDALGDNEPKVQREAKIAYDVACDKPVCTQSEWDETRLGAAQVGLKLPEQSPRTSDYTPTRLPKWDPRWAEQSTESARRDLRDYGSVFYRHSMQDGKLVVEHIPLETVYVTQHPMAAETIRDHDERLAGGEDRL